MVSASTPATMPKLNGSAIVTSYRRATRIRESDRPSIVPAQIPVAVTVRPSRQTRPRTSDGDAQGTSCQRLMEFLNIMSLPHQAETHAKPRVEYRPMDQNRDRQNGPERSCRHPALLPGSYEQSYRNGQADQEGRD